MDTCGRLVVVKIAGAQPRHETPESFALLRVEQIPRRAHERVDPRIREHRAPGQVLAFLREGKRKLLARGPLETVSPPRAAFGIDRPEPETPLATLTRAAATSAMRHGECRAKVARRTRARCSSSGGCERDLRSEKTPGIEVGNDTHPDPEVFHDTP